MAYRLRPATTAARPPRQLCSSAVADTIRRCLVRQVPGSHAADPAGQASRRAVGVWRIELVREFGFLRPILNQDGQLGLVAGWASQGLSGGLAYPTCDEARISAQQNGGRAGEANSIVFVLQ